jgi:hypothetical protein
MKKEPKKYQPVDVVLRPCSFELAKAHLRALTAFLESTYAERWIHITIEKPEKAARDGLQKFERHLIKTRLEGGDIFPASFAELYGAKPGVYFDFKEPPSLMTAAEAASHVGFQAILSLVPGKSAILFAHDRVGYAWACEKR